jgi:hypothetical protein
MCHQWSVAESLKPIISSCHKIYGAAILHKLATAVVKKSATSIRRGQYLTTLIDLHITFYNENTSIFFIT